MNAKDVVTGAVDLVDTSRRNLNFRIEGPTSLFAKIARDDTGRLLLGNEAAALTAFAGWAERLRPLRAPILVHHDPDLGVLITELVAPAETQTAYHQRIGRTPKWIARSLGKGLGALHHVSRRAGLTGDAVELWALSVPDPQLDAVAGMSPANLELMRIVQRHSAACECLVHLRETWQATSLVHNDVKSDNCLVPNRGARRNEAVVLTDWETATYGDPRWDVGSVVGDYLTKWATSIPIVADAPPDRYLDRAKTPIAAVQGACAEFCAAYARAREWSPAVANGFLLEAVSFSGARLLQTAFEMQQRSSQLHGTAVCLTQIAVNVLAQPHASITNLLKLELR